MIDSLDMGDGNYVILLAYDTYDVPSRDRNGGDLDESDQVRTSGIPVYSVLCMPGEGRENGAGVFPGGKRVP